MNAYKIAQDELIVTDDKGREKLIEESKAADQAARLIRANFCYNASAAVWHQFTLTHWQTVLESNVLPHFSAILTNGAGELGFKQNYLNSVVTLIRKSDMLPLPPADKGKIPFSNGLLDVVTGNLGAITRNNAQTWAIPHPYDKTTDCIKFKAWLNDAVSNDATVAEFIRGYMSACLTGRADLQKLLMLIGPGGTGKGTLLRVLVKMMGDVNCTVTDMKNLESNRFETARLYGKRLVTITDAGRYTGSIDTLKAMIGQDDLRHEEKNKQQNGSFCYEGMVIIASNHQPAFNDYTSSIERRLLVVNFIRRYTNEEKIKFQQNGGENQLYAEIPAIIKWALDVTPDNVTQLFMKPPNAVIDSTNKTLSAQNPIREWIETNLIVDQKSFVRTGSKKESRDHGVIKYENWDSMLYPNYLTFCLESNRKPLNLNNFREHVVDQLITLKYDVKSIKLHGSPGIRGIRIRKENEASKSYHVEI
ncbi:MAG: phage/plasmid primase, P4 family [Proteobacteria bacterium]|nr:phage/plasmid primase, P4 family [Pseudomonadota bacterium]